MMHEQLGAQAEAAAAKQANFDAHFGQIDVDLEHSAALVEALGEGLEELRDRIAGSASIAAPVSEYLLRQGRHIEQLRQILDEKLRGMRVHVDAIDPL